MQGRRSLKRSLAPYFDNINQPRKILISLPEEAESNFNEVENPCFEREVFVQTEESGCDSSDDSFILEEMANNPRYMGDFARPTFGTTASAIVLPTEVRNYDLKHNHLNLLPSYHGMANEDALQFVREFCTVVQSMPLLALTEDQLKLKCFPYTLKDRAKSWYLSLPPNSLTTWNAVCEKFMLKYYPNHKTQEVRTKIMNFIQAGDEPFHEAWERFRELLQQCPHHQMAPEMLWQFFYDGLAQTAQFMVDSTAGGNIAVKTADELLEIFETLAASSQQKSTRTRRVEVSVVAESPDMKKQLASMMRELQELKMSKPDVSPPRRAPARQEIVAAPCGICGEQGHNPTECQRMGEPTYEGGAEVYAAQGYPPRQQFNQNQQQQNSGWQNPSNTGWRNQNQGQGSGGNFQNHYPPQQFEQFPPQQQWYPQQQQSLQQFQPPQQASMEDSLSAFIHESKRAREA